MFAARWQKNRHASARIVFLTENIVKSFPFPPSLNRLNTETRLQLPREFKGKGSQERWRIGEVAIGRIGAIATEGVAGDPSPANSETRMRLTREFWKKFTGQLHPCD